MKYLSIAGLLLALFCINAFMPVSAETSATIQVADGAVAISFDGICSLLEASANAQNTLSGLIYGDCSAGDPTAEDTIELAANGSYLFDASINNIIINEDMSIVGNGATLDHQTSGFFFLSAGHLSLRNLTLKGSDGSLSAIRGIGSLTLRNATFKENVRTSPASGLDSGAAIDISLVSVDHFLNINNSVFENNVAEYHGGAIHITVGSNSSADAITIMNSRFEGNGRWIATPGITTLSGGAIYISASSSSITEQINIDSTKFFDNYAYDGGAIMVVGADGTISNSGFDGNEAGRHGGAINTSNEAELRVEHSVISNNSALKGGGILNRNASIVVYNSTISGNSADEAGGVQNISAAGDSVISAITLDFSTIVNNSSALSTPGGVYNDDNSFGVGSTILIQNSIVYGNTHLGVGYVDCDLTNGSIISFGYNLGANSPLSGCPFAEPSDENASGALTDHILTLADNGGPTRSHALTSTSTAKNKIPVGSNGCGTSTLDQRGYLRSSGNGLRCDIGAFEFEADTLPVSPTAVGMLDVSAETTPLTPSLTIALILTMSGTAHLLRRRYSDST